MNNEKLIGDLYEERKRIWNLIENSKLADAVKANERFAVYEFALQELKHQIFFEEDWKCSND